jgi:uncharacterized protein (TIGR03435 family)
MPFFLPTNPAQSHTRGQYFFGVQMRLRTIRNALVLAMALSGIASFGVAQTAQKPRFDVASIKANVTDVAWHDSRDNCAMGYVSILILPVVRARVQRGLIPCILASAYNLQPFQILGGPAWVNSVHFDIDAKSATRVSDPQQVRAMLQSLLAERFQLRIHTETRQMPIYVLSAPKGAYKLHAPTKGSCLGVADPLPGLPAPSHPGQPPAAVIGRCGVVAGTGGPTGSRIDGGQASISSLARFLTTILHGPVIDKTWITGNYDIHIAYVGTNTLATDATADTGPTLFEALEEQAGLKLEPGRGPLEVLVIDHAEKPDTN